MEKRELYQINGYVKSDIGLLRHNNEDNFFLGGQWNQDCRPQIETFYRMENELQWDCFCVFDGMGGGDRGELASRLAAEVTESYRSELSRLNEYTQIDQIMQKIFLEANNSVVNTRQKVSLCGTTGTACVTDGIMLKIFHAGDSRAYLYREGKLFRLTKDQTLAQLKLDSGFYQSIAEAKEREHHQLTEYIGRDETMQYFRAVEGKWIDFRMGDQILLCSDGLYEACMPSQIEGILEKKVSLKEKADDMMRIVFENGARDNITCMLIEKAQKEEES